PICCFSVRGVRYSSQTHMALRPEKEKAKMAILIGDTAPDFTLDSTEGPIHFHDYIDGSWAVLFSHPKNYTPVCTTELGYTAKLKPEFEKRGVKVLGLSVDKLEDHGGWAKDIEETQGAALNFPLLADTEGKVARLYDM